MRLFGLHWIDWLIVVAYVVIVLVVTDRLSRRVKTQSDFYLAGRKLGRWFQFFLNFGNMTGEPSTAALTASSVYSQGAAGGWLQMISLFLTPYFWFMAPWFRRARETTIGDLFAARFGRRFLTTLYATVEVVKAPLTLGLANVVALKILQPIFMKPGLEHGIAVSYLQPLPFYLFSNSLACLMIMFGGLKASAVIDAIQSILIVVISVILIPFGLHRIGGLHGLHERVPSALFALFGGTAVGEYAWYSIAAFLLLQGIGLNAGWGNMGICGSATDETAARLGMVTGGFAKRFVTMAWCACGLLALALYGRHLADPDQAWGNLTRTLLPAGLIGVMLVGMLGGKLASLGAGTVVLVALMVKNIYEPLFPRRSAGHYLLVSRVCVPIMLLAGVVVGLYLTSAIAIFKLIIALAVVWGAPVMLMFTWRRLTETAVRVQVIVTFLFIGIVPFAVSAVPTWRHGVYFDGNRFNIELYSLHLLGAGVPAWAPAARLAARYLVDAVLPFLFLIGISLLTKPTDPDVVAEFYARLKTPVGATPEAERLAMAESRRDPTRFDHTKIFPASDWEFTKWDRTDTVGFFACCLMVVFILLLMKGLLALA